MYDFDSDKAIKAEKIEDYEDLDILGRLEYSKYLGDAILKYNGNDCLVMGLIGKWGQGKTSIINMASAHIKKESKNSDYMPIIINFNPWIFSSQNQLIKKFFDELSSAISNYTVKNKLKTYVNKIIPPIMGLASILDPQRTQALIKNSEYFDFQSEEETLEDLKEEINNLLLKKVKQKIIVIIDDIDRLSPSEIRLIFKLVKLIADFPNTIYLLSFDREVVVDALKGENEISGEKYLKKIVQIPFEVPDIYRSDIENYLFEQIDPLFQLNTLYRDKWFNYYNLALKHFFNNLRDVKLFLNAIKLNYEVINDEVNPHDFLAITAIQIFNNELYHNIRNNKDLFTGIFKDKSDVERLHAETLYNSLFSLVPDNISSSMDNLLKQMFPKISNITSRDYVEGSLNLCKKNLSICSPDIFDICFKLSIPKGEFTAREVNYIISNAKNVNLFSGIIEDLNNNNRTTSFLRKFEDLLNNIDKENIENVIIVLMDQGDNLFDEEVELSDIYTQMRIHNIINQLLWRFDNYDSRFEILETAIKKAQNSLLTAVKQVGEEGNYGRYGLEQPKVERVSSEQLKQLEQLVCEKIDQWVVDGRLQKHHNIIQILDYWNKWEPLKSSLFIEQMIKTDEGLINFIKAFKEKSTKFSNDSKISEQLSTINFNSIGKFVNLDNIYPRINEINSSSDFEQFDVNSRKSIELFLNRYSNKNSIDE